MKEILIIAYIVLPIFFGSVYAHGFTNLDGLTNNQIDMITQASSDIYHYPDDNKLSKDQILKFIELSESAINTYRSELNELRFSSDSTTNNNNSCEKPIYQLAKIIAVKTDKFNWAEYDWIYRQLKQLTFLQKIRLNSFDDTATFNIHLMHKYNDRIHDILNFC